jgi:hypothetical protein
MNATLRASRSRRAITSVVAGGDRLREFGTIAAFAALLLDELRDELPLAAVEILQHGLALCRDPEAAQTLLVGRNPQVRHELSGLFHHGTPTPCAEEEKYRHRSKPTVRTAR